MENLLKLCGPMENLLNFYILMENVLKLYGHMKNLEALEPYGEPPRSSMVLCKVFKGFKVLCKTS